MGGGNVCSGGQKWYCTSPFRSPDMRPAAMRLFLSLLLLFIALLLPFAGAQAVTIENLHTASVEVDDKSEKERARAFREGLERVLVKMAGSAAVLDQWCKRLVDSVFYCSRSHARSVVCRNYYRNPWFLHRIES